MTNFQAIFFLGNEVDCPVPSSEQHFLVVHTYVPLKILMGRIIVYEMCILTYYEEQVESDASLEFC